MNKRNQSPNEIFHEFLKDTKEDIAIKYIANIS